MAVLPLPLSGLALRPLGHGSADVAATAALSPLAEIEAQVQARSKDLNLDLGTVPGRAVLGQLVERAIADWEAEHKRGYGPSRLPTRRWWPTGCCATWRATGPWSCCSPTTTCGR